MQIGMSLINGCVLGIEHLNFDEYVDDDMPNWMIVVNLLVVRLTFARYSE